MRKKNRQHQKSKQKNTWPEIEPESDSLHNFFMGEKIRVFYFNGDNTYKLNTYSFLVKGDYIK